MHIYEGMEYVYTVYKEGGFTAGARKLFISQPSLSASVRLIEEKLGYPIFDRSTKPVSLTEYGRKYIEAAERILQVENDFSNYVNDIDNLRTGKLTLGGSNLYSSWIIPPIMAAFNSKHPLINLVLIEEYTVNLYKRLAAETIDIIIENYPHRPDELDRLFFRKEHVLLAVPASYEINKSLGSYRLPLSCIKDGSFLEDMFQVVPLQSFSDYPFILMKPANHTRIVSDRLLSECRMEPHVSFEIDQQMTSYNITCSGLGISFISDTLINCVPVNPNVIFYKLDPEICTHDVFFYWKAGRYMTRAMKEFIAIATAQR